jgi:hypothetical protein
MHSFSPPCVLHALSTSSSLLHASIIPCVPFSNTWDLGSLRNVSSPEDASGYDAMTRSPYRNKVAEAACYSPGHVHKPVSLIPEEYCRKLNHRLENINYFKRFSRLDYERSICFGKFMNRKGVYEHTRVLSWMRKAHTQRTWTGEFCSVFIFRWDQRYETVWSFWYAPIKQERQCLLLSFSSVTTNRNAKRTAPFQTLDPACRSESGDIYTNTKRCNIPNAVFAVLISTLTLKIICCRYK